MLDTLAPGRIVVGLLRGPAGKYFSYDLNPQEARERTDEGMELILKAWTEPQPFGWQGRHFQYRTVSIWPRPQDPPPPTYALGTSAEAGEFAARHHIGLGLSYGSFEIMARATNHYRDPLRALRLDARAGRHHLPRQHDPWRNRRCGGGRAARGGTNRGRRGADGGARRAARGRHRAQRRRRTRAQPGSAACCRSASAAAGAGGRTAPSAVASRSVPAWWTCRWPDPAPVTRAR